MAKPSERAQEIIKKMGGTLRSRQVLTLLQIMDEDWREKHQQHTNNGESCAECRQYGFVVER